MFDATLVFASGLAYAFVGVRLVLDPVSLLNHDYVLTALDFIEAKTSLVDESSAPLLGLVGTLLVLSGISYVMATYTVDEKAKRDSVSTRFLAGMGVVYLNKNTSHGSSLSVLLGLFIVIPALLLGLDAGFADGNSVDLEEFAKAQAEKKKAEGEAAKIAASK
ncbi:hypothetical protein MNV49_004253 [Pseudohyphozyma bogoriensis]|nr:hypothetical protein MNV49_004253 [Pseudohyphozyma bogoriensis]